MSTLGQAMQAQVDDISSISRIPPGPVLPAPRPAPASASPPREDNYVSKIAILASSIPYYHNQYMEHKKKEEREKRERRARAADQEGEEMTPDEAAYFSKLSINTNPGVQSSEDQAATARRLKPHSRSTIQLQYITSQAREKPEELTRTPSKKNRTRWQFGIRSRNLPHEAMHCVYKALAAQHANWEVPRPSTNQPKHAPSTYPIHVAGATHLSDSLSRGSDSPDHASRTLRSDGNHGTDEYMFDFDGVKDATPDAETTITTPHGEENDDDVDPHVIPEGYIPKDPWCIKVRWRKDGMYAPGTVHSNSAHSSRLDLNNNENRRRNSVISSLSSAAASTASVGTVGTGGTGGTGGTVPTTGAEGACYVYMDVQLYTLEAGSDKHSGTFLVDFKCAGYESLVETTVNETEKALVGSGYRVSAKDVTSPQPFLDLTNKLVIHLAGGGG